MPRTMSLPKTCWLAVVCLAWCAEAPARVPATAQEASKEEIVFWENNADDSRLMAVRVKDNKSRRLSAKPGRDEIRFDAPVVVAPDGKWVAYRGTTLRDDAEGEGVVHVRLLDKADAKSRSLRVKGMPVCWSPDGKQLIVVDLNEDAFPHTIVNVSKNESVPLSLPAIPKAKSDRGSTVQLVTDWSRSGKWLVVSASFIEEEGRERLLESRLYLTNSDGSEPQHLKHIGDAMTARFSPDGKRILYLRPDGDRSYLYAADVKSSKPVRVSQALNGSIGEFDFCWSPDGKRVAYSWHNEEKAADAETFLMVVDADGTNERALLSVKGDQHQLGSPHWR